MEFSYGARRFRHVIVLLPRMTSTQRRRQALAFACPAALIMYYALRGGSYDIVIRQEEGLVLWWAIALGSLAGLFPARRPPRLAWVGLGALALFGLWTALSLRWTESDERTLAEIARVFNYLGVILLAWL